MGKWEFGSGNGEVGMGKWERGMRKWECGGGNTDWGIGNSECGIVKSAMRNKIIAQSASRPEEPILRYASGERFLNSEGI